MGGEEGRKEKEGREEIVGREEEDEGGAEEWACWLLHHPVNWGQYDGNKLHNEAWRQLWKCVQEATLYPSDWIFYFYFIFFFFRTSQQSGRFGNLARVTLKIKYAQADQAANLWDPGVFFWCDVTALNFLEVTCQSSGVGGCDDGFVQRSLLTLRGSFQQGREMKQQNVRPWLPSRKTSVFWYRFGVAFLHNDWTQDGPL